MTYRPLPVPPTVTQPYWLPLPPLPGHPAPLEALIEGSVVQHDGGSFFLRRLTLPLDHAYGGCSLGDLLHVSPRTAAALGRAPELGDVSLERLLFLDTETTGLAGGTGTYVFMIGLGYVQRAGAERTFVVDQLLMRSYGEERAMLSWLAAHLEQFEALATFNGRVFDLPLLGTRFRLSRLRVDLEEWPHFDLLPPARRLWKGAVQSCALQSLERHILGIGRQDDIDSFLIPVIYHQFLRDGDGRYLQRVFNHNQADVLSMVALAVRACGALDTSWPDDAAQGEQAGRRWRPTLSAAEQAGLGRIYEQLDQPAAAERAYRTALEGELARDLRRRTLLALAALLKRTGRHDDAAALWQCIADESPAQSVLALVELSKYWEHRRRDPHRAHELAALARERWIARQLPAGRPLPGLSRWSPPVPAHAPPDDFERRLARLDSKRRRDVPASEAAARG